MGNTPARKITPVTGVFLCLNEKKKYGANERKTAMQLLLGILLEILFTKKKYEYTTL